MMTSVADEEFIQVGPVSPHYWESGTGAPTVLIHGDRGCLTGHLPRCIW